MKAVIKATRCTRYSEVLNTWIVYPRVIEGDPIIKVGEWIATRELLT